MRHVILTVGPQYSGKSTFCKVVASAHPNVVYISRDEILIQMFGTVWLNRYSGGHYTALEKMWKILAEHLREKKVTVILDTWNSDNNDRREIVTRLRLCLQVDRVDAWYFVTPEEVCFKWFLARDHIERKSSKSLLPVIFDIRRWQSRHSYQFFHSQPMGQGLFDGVLEIDPCQPYLFDLSEVFHFQG